MKAAANNKRGKMPEKVFLNDRLVDIGKAFAQAGGGIVADSDPEAEWQETITKARALLAGIATVNLNT